MKFYSQKEIIERLDQYAEPLNVTGKSVYDWWTNMLSEIQESAPLSWAMIPWSLDVGTTQEFGKEKRALKELFNQVFYCQQNFKIEKLPFIFQQTENDEVFKAYRVKT